MAELHEKLNTELINAGLSRQTIDQLHNDGFVIIDRPAQQSILMQPSEEGRALFIVYQLLSIDPSTDSEFLALALALNLSPSLTLNVCIGFDEQQSSLCLRCTHDLDSQTSVKDVLEQLEQIATRFTLSLRSLQQPDRHELDPPPLISAVKV